MSTSISPPNSRVLSACACCRVQHGLLEPGQLTSDHTLQGKHLLLYRSHQLAIATHLGEEPHESLPSPQWNSDWLGLVQITTADVCA